MGSKKRERLINTGVNTRVIHHKENFSEETGSIMPPISQPQLSFMAMRAALTTLVQEIPIFEFLNQFCLILKNVSSQVYLVLESLQLQQ